MYPPTVLIVDDDPQVRHCIATLLDTQGYRVAQAANGFEALDYLHSHDRPCLILLDLTMPKMNGWVFRAHLREDPGLASIPVVVLSGVPDLYRETTDLNVFYLDKPPHWPVLLSIVECYALRPESDSMLAGRE